MRKVDVAVIGAGQAGLASSYYLSQSGIDHVVLDRAGVAETWRSERWDSFRLNIPNWSFTLPGFPYDGPDPDAFMGRDEIVERFTRYATLISAPVEKGIDVTALELAPGGSYLLTSSAGPFSARAVIVATGAYQRHRRPANALDAGILQLTTDQYRNPRELEEGGVLVVGSGQSGCQIAEDLLENGRRVWLATGTCGWMPRRYRGRDNIAWRMDMRLFDDTVEQLGYDTRLACPPIQTGVGRDRDLSLRTLHESGVRLMGRYLDGEGRTLRLAEDLPHNAARSDEFARRFIAGVDSYIHDAGIDAPAPPPFLALDNLDAAPTSLDLASENITTIIWSTGFRLDFSWIELDLNARDGYPEQSQGVSRHPGLYFIGLQLMHSRKSGLIFGVGEDAAHVAAAAAQYLGARPAATAPGGSPAFQ